MFLYIVLFVMILLALMALVVIGLNLGPLLTNVQLNLLIRHLNIPVLLLCLLSALLGGLLLYLVSTISARRDAQKIKKLRARIEELEQQQTKTSANSSPSAPAAPVVPMPGFASAGPPQTGPFPPGPPMQQPPPGTGSLTNLSPSSSGVTKMPFPPRQGPPPSLPQTGGLRPPFPQQ